VLRLDNLFAVPLATLNGGVRHGQLFNGRREEKLPENIPVKIMLD